jgi:MHS family alpha-ketoglutarate permease-like MFS transporter
MRPVGVAFGRMADRHGRRLALTASVLLMAGSAMIVSTMATVDRHRGACSLLFARLIQDEPGGEYGTSATYLSEMATARHRGFIRVSVCHADRRSVDGMLVLTSATLC